MLIGYLHLVFCALQDFNTYLASASSDDAKSSESEKSSSENDSADSEAAKKQKKKAERKKYKKLLKEMAKEGREKEHEMEVWSFLFSVVSFLALLLTTADYVHPRVGGQDTGDG